MQTRFWKVPLCSLAPVIQDDLPQSSASQVTSLPLTSSSSPFLSPSFLSLGDCQLLLKGRWYFLIVHLGKVLENSTCALEVLLVARSLFVFRKNYKDFQQPQLLYHTTYVQALNKTWEIILFHEVCTKGVASRLCYTDFCYYVVAHCTVCHYKKFCSRCVKIPVLPNLENNMKDYLRWHA